MTFKTYLLVGIKGVGMTALASVLIDMGKQIQGWDVVDDFVTKNQLERLKVKIFNQEHIPQEVEAIIFTAAHQDAQHPIVKAATKNGLPIFSLAEVTGALSQLKSTIAVCGVGGKSTTSAMLAWIFDQTTHQSSFMVGVGEIIGMDRTGAWFEKTKQSFSHKIQDGNWFIVEADEYAANPTAVQNGQPVHPRFLSLSPDIIVCTQILHDHPDVYPTITDTLKTFDAFFQKLPNRGVLIINADDTNSQKLVLQLKQKRPELNIIQIGRSSHADVRITDIRSKPDQTSAKLRLSSQIKSNWQSSRNELQLELRIPGSMNVWNAAAALTAAAQAGLSITQILENLQTFQSTSRRLEKIATDNQVIYYDDYAHHPQEILAAIEALRSWYSDQPIHIIFQPHTFSRTKSLLTEFAYSLSQADQVILLPIFASARESDTSTVSSQNLLAEIHKLGGHATLVSSLQAAADWVTNIKKGLVVTMGAGDVYLLHDHLKIFRDRHKLKTDLHQLSKTPTQF